MDSFKQKKEPLVSVVVPVYNVEKYLQKCVDSLLAQSYRNLEIILVDDGSTDSSLYICREYEKRDNRIKVVHKENGGLSSARNEGIQKATGQYITFIDSDDYVNQCYVEMLAQNASDKSISIVGHQRVFEGDSESAEEKQCQMPKYMKIGKEEIFKLYMKDNNFVSAWGKLFPLSYFDTVCFPVGKIYEDFSTIYKLYDQATNFYVYENKLYNYLMRDTSITHKSFSKKNLDMIEAYDCVENFIQREGMEYLQDYFTCRKIRGYLTLYSKIMQATNGQEYEETKKQVQNYINKLSVLLLFKRKISVKTKIAYLSYKLSPKFFLALMEKKE